MQNDGDFVDIILLYFADKLPISPVLFLCHLTWMLHVTSPLNSNQNFSLPYPRKSICGWLSCNMKGTERITETYSAICTLFGITGYCAACTRVIPALEIAMTARNNVTNWSVSPLSSATTGQCCHLGTV